MHSTSSSTILLAMLVVLAVCTAIASYLQVFHRQPTLDARTEIYMTGPITLTFLSLPLPASYPVGLLNVQLDTQAIALDFIAASLTYLLLSLASRWLYDAALTLTHARLGFTPGRTAAISTLVLPRAASATERHARFVDKAVHLETNIPPDAPPLSTVSAAIEYPRRVAFRPVSSPSIAAGFLIEATLLGHRLDYEGVGSVGNQWFAIQPATSYLGIHQVIADGRSQLESIESLNQNGGELLLPPQSASDRLVPDHPLPVKNAANLITARNILALSILVVGLDWAHRSGWYLPGVAHDIYWLKWICSGFNHTVTLDTLTDATDATHEIIYSKILGMFQNARPGSAIAIYFNGHGNGNFILYDETHVDAEILVRWITTIRKKTGKYLPVCVVFDHCRFELPTPPSVDLGQDIYILWACMPGQRCADFKMGQDFRVPFSNFLKAFSLVAAEARGRSADDLMSRLNAWMGAIVHGMRADECRSGGCLKPCPSCTCSSYESCVHAKTRLRHQNRSAYPRIQNPNGIFWGVNDGARRVRTSVLLEIIKPFLPVGRIKETAETIKRQEGYLPANESLAPVNEGSLFRPPSLQTRRGKSVVTAAGSAPLLPIERAARG